MSSEDEMDRRLSEVGKRVNDSPGREHRNDDESTMRAERATDLEPETCRNSLADQNRLMHERLS